MINKIPIEKNVYLTKSKVNNQPEYKLFENELDLI